MKQDIGATRERLLEAAGEVFAENGFRAATIRDICRRAGANVAAVNYHFRDKEHLYAAVLQYAHRYAMETYPPTLYLDSTAPAEERLGAFVRSFLRRLLDEGRPAWHGKLMGREMMEPTSALETLVEQSIGPQYRLLVSIVQELAGPDVDLRGVRLCASSVVGQCMHFYLARPILSRLIPDIIQGSQSVDLIAGHIIGFSLTAIRHLGEGGGDRI